MFLITRAPIASDHCCVVPRRSTRFLAHEQNGIDHCNVSFFMFAQLGFGLGSQVLQPSQTQRITIVIDLAGVRVMDLVGESMAFLKTTVGMMSKHYPQRSFKV